MWSRWSESCRFDIVFDFTLNLWCEAQGCLFVFLSYTYYAPKFFTLSSSASSRTEGASQEISRAAQRKTNAVTVFVRFEKTVKILFERQNIFLLFLINPNVFHSYLPASGSKLNKLDTDTIFHSKQLRRTLKFTDKYGAIEKAVAPTKRPRPYVIKWPQMTFRGENDATVLQGYQVSHI